MATTSKFVQLTSSVLLEYIYADQSAINVAGNQFRLNTSTNPIWLLENKNIGEFQILNADSAERIQSGLPIGTGNVRNRSFAQISQYQSALLSINKLVPYNDYDSNLVETFPVPFTNPQAPVYDTIRLHLVQGFNFETYSGLTLSVKCKRKDDKTISLLNLVYNRTDTFETLNPSSFFFGGRVYDTYLEFRVLSLYNLIYDYWIGTLTGDTTVERITEGVGIKRNQQIQLTFAWIQERKKINNQDFIYLYDTVPVDIPVQDQFETVAAYIGESEAGDYIEFYGTYKGDIIAQFISDLNKSGNDYMMLHNLVVSEYIYDPSSASYFWQKTEELELSQIDNYEEPNVFRPVIKNSSAISFKIDYTARLYNREDNSQIWKTASMISTSASKYGKSLLKLNLDLNPVQAKIYNQNVVKEIQVNRIVEPVLENAKFITSFLDNTQISISYESINPDSSVSTPPSLVTKNNEAYVKTGNSNIFANGLGRILITDSICYLKFVIYQKNPSVGGNSPLNLSGIGDLILSFISNTGENIDIQEYPTTSTSKERGEIVFRLSETQSRLILGLSNKQFRIFLKNPKGERTFIYNGKFYNQDEWMSITETDRIAALEKNLSDLTQVNSKLLSQLQSNVTLLEETQSQVENLTRQLSAESVQNTREAQIITSLTNQNRSQQQAINTLNRTIKELNASLSLAQSKILSDGGLMSTLESQLASQNIVLDQSKPKADASQNQQSQLEKDLQSVKGSIQKTPATTYTAPINKSSEENFRTTTNLEGGTFVNTSSGISMQ